MILDTNILIDIERGRIQRDALPDVALAITTITVAEYGVGIELSTSSRRARAMERFIEAARQVCTVLDYTERTADHHARLIAECRRSGRIRSAHDLIIAAHALETGSTILTRDAGARFGELGGVAALSPEDL